MWNCVCRIRLVQDCDNMQTVLAKEDFALSDSQFNRISELVYKHCGINLCDGKKELVRSRLVKRLRLLEIDSFKEYIDYALNDTTDGEFCTMIDSISTNLTSFFREKQHFDFLTASFLPSLMAKRSKAGNQKIRAWSAGCSSGEEPYTIAITLLDAFAGKGNWDTKILATDISTKIVEKAKAGIYDKQRIESLTLNQKQKYMKTSRIDGQLNYQVSPILKSIITFGYLNLMKEFPFKGPFDFIFCRNVMIYFDKPTQEKLIHKFWNVLNPGGILFTGHSESLTGVKHNYKYLLPTIYQKA